MFKRFTLNRLLIEAIAVCVLFVGCSFLYLQDAKKEAARVKAEIQAAEQARVERQKQQAEAAAAAQKADTAQQGGHFHDDGTSLAAPNTEHAPTTQTAGEGVERGPVRRVQTSTNPMFAEGVPEHLQCPEEWVGSYLSDLPSEAAPLMQKIAAEVIDKYNPNRPLMNVWDQYIAAEKAYQNEADPEKRNLTVGANRFDWYIQTILDFPEIVILGLEDGSRWSDMRVIDMGIMTPDWNVQRLPDGRELRTADGYYYTVIRSSGTADEYSESHISFGHSGPDATPVTIDLANTSDAELERLGGWNFNINPYTSGLYQLGDNPRAIDLGDYE